MKKKLPLIVLGYAFIAYFGAIALKEIVQYFTYGLLIANTTYAPAVLGLYFGLQTVVFEIGLAYLVACFAISKKHFKLEDAEGYGASLAFWENGILLGALTFVSLAASYILIAVGPTTTAQAIYSSMYLAEPALFGAISTSSVVVVLLGILERVSSIMIHFAWGYLVLVAAYLRKNKYLLMALPMGLVDFLVPYASYIPLWAFEGIVFAIALAALIVALKVRKNLMQGSNKKNKG